MGKWPQKCSDGAPKSAFQTSAEAGKVMKHFFRAWQSREVACWSGEARASAHGLRFSCVEGGSLLGELSSVCLSVCVSTQNTEKSRFFESGKSLISPSRVPKLRVWAREKMCKLRCSRAHQGQVFLAARACSGGRMTAPCARNFVCTLCQKLTQKGGTPPGWDQGGFPGWENDPKSDQMVHPKAPSRPVRRLEK